MNDLWVYLGRMLVTKKSDRGKFSLDIFNILGRISKKDYNFSDEEMKAIQPMVVMRWLSGTTNIRQVFFLNEFVNRYCFQFSNHKQLLLNLMTVTTDGKFQRYTWLKRVKQAPKFPMITKIIKQYYNYNNRHALSVIHILTPDTIRQHAESLGYQKDDMKILEKELKLL